MTILNGNGLQGSLETPTTVFIDHGSSDTLVLTFGLGDMSAGATPKTVVRPELSSNGKSAGVSKVPKERIALMTKSTKARIQKFFPEEPGGPDGPLRSTEYARGRRWLKSMTTLEPLTRTQIGFCVVSDNNIGLF